ncbi:hypothetical protein J0A68_04735 [Algoriphagus sp. H41]|uniref:PIN domain-containing protein n=1 Tax=Algoriphagus oliviformis TaxID=2811231 RepID=A0ABS3C243_9BACT|nr:hypothetical protein [Algoriphagus oliviformis]
MGKSATYFLTLLPKITFYSPGFIVEELAKHLQKLLRLSGIESSEMAFLQKTVLGQVKLVDLSELKPEIWKQAIDLVKDVDEFDAPFVALSLHLNGFLWTGDKKLKSGLLRKSQEWVIDTDQLLEFRQSLE